MRSTRFSVPQTPPPSDSSPHMRGLINLKKVGKLTIQVQCLCVYASIKLFMVGSIKAFKPLNTRAKTLRHFSCNNHGLDSQRVGINRCTCGYRAGFRSARSSSGLKIQSGLKTRSGGKFTVPCLFAHLVKLSNIGLIRL